MNAPGDPDWLEYLELTVAAVIASLARGITWSDPRTGYFSLQQLIVSIATSMTIAIIAAAAQAKWGFPVPITAFLAVFGSLVGLPFIVTAAQQIGTAALSMFIRSRLDPPPKETDGKRPDASDKT